MLSELLQRGDVHDDMLQSHLVSVTEVRMSPDLRHATVFVKPLLGQDEEVVLKALRQNTAFLQREVAQRVRMKYAAKLKFLADESFDEGSQIDRLLALGQGRPGPRRGMIDWRLTQPMTGDGCRAELFAERASRRARARPAPRIATSGRSIRSTSVRTDFDDSIDALRSSAAEPHLRPVRRRRARRHVELPRHRRRSPVRSRSAAPITARTCAAPASTAGSRT